MYSRLQKATHRQNKRFKSKVIKIHLLTKPFSRFWDSGEPQLTPLSKRWTIDLTELPSNHQVINEHCGHHYSKSLWFNNSKKAKKKTNIAALWECHGLDHCWPKKTERPLYYLLKLILIIPKNGTKCIWKEWILWDVAQKPTLFQKKSIILKIAEQDNKTVKYGRSSVVFVAVNISLWQKILHSWLPILQWEKKN